MLRIVARYLWRELAEAFAAALATLVILFAAMGMIEAVLDTFPIYYTLLLAAYEVPYKLQWILPLAALVGCVTAYGRLAGDNEIMAMRASGIHPATLFAPAICLAVILTAAGGYLNANIVPACRHLMKQTALDAGLSNPAAMSGVAGNRIKLGAVQLHFREMYKGHLYGVVIRQVNKYGNVEKIEAKEGDLRIDRENKMIYITLWDGTAALRDEEYMFGETPTYFEEYKLEVSMKEARLDDSNLGRKSMPTRWLTASIERDAYLVEHPDGLRFSRPLSRDDRLKMLTIVALRRSMAWAPIPFVLIGVPLGLVARRGRKIVGFSISLCVFLVYFPLLIAGQALAENGTLPAWIALNACNVVIGVCGVILSAVLVWRR